MSNVTTPSEKHLQAIRENYHYSETTGKVTWKKVPARSHDIYIGKEAGTVTEQGYRTMYVQGKTVKCHHVAWFLHYGEWPSDWILHKDGNQLNNKITNLSTKKETIANKPCSCCGQHKNESDFPRGRRTCKSCRKKKHDTWRENEKDTLRKTRSKYWSVRGIHLYREYRKNNKDRMKETANRWRNLPENKIKNNLRGRLRKVLLAAGTRKRDKTFSLIGCSAKDLKIHLESQWTEGMSWENYGNPNGDHSDCWHIDHIRPCNSFNLLDPEQQKKCFHFTNLQPLWGKDNIRKHARLDWSSV